jgi:hypothetical protein
VVASRLSLGHPLDDHGIGGGRSTVLVIATCLPVSEDVTTASITSST